jgi:Rps23 Pro-64 3,4-dihydroxylase Tpa1-like proline 4-hydroxylase
MINNNNLYLPSYTYFSYRTSLPYPYTVIDNFLDPWILQEVNQELDLYDNWSFDQESTEYQSGKKYTPDFLMNSEDVIQFSANAPRTKFVLDYLNSNTILSFLENLTGIPNLLPDHQFIGGGAHQSANKDKLDIHADFNVHPLSGMYRRINLLLYISPQWKKEWGGELELWDRQLTGCQVKIPPLFNRAVIFNTGSDSYHGHPTPMRMPRTAHRRSLALYYYTAVPPAEFKESHPVLWKKVDN